MHAHQQISMATVS